MSSFYLFFESTDRLADIGIADGWTVSLNGFHVLHVRGYALPWDLIRECFSYAIVTPETCTINADKEDQHLVTALVQEALSLNLPSLRITL